MKDADLYDCIDRQEVAQSTKTAYATRLRAISKIFNKPLVDILRDPSGSMKILKEKYTNEKTLKGAITPLLALFKFCPELKETYAKQYGVWRGKLDDAFQAIEQDVLKGRMTERQKEGYVPFGEFKRKMYEMPPRSRDRLLFAMYGLIPPMRADFNRVRIYEDTVPDNPEANYILIKTRRGKTPTARLHIGEYKTARSYGVIDELLPTELVREIMGSLETHPREWLFQGRNKEPYTPNQFSKMTAKVFKEALGKPLTVQILRHSFLSGLDWNKLTLEDRTALGKAMGHSPTQGDRYRWINVDKQMKS
jgi:integrase